MLVLITTNTDFQEYVTKYTMNDVGNRLYKFIGENRVRFKNQARLQAWDKQLKMSQIWGRGGFFPKWGGMIKKQNQAHCKK